MSGKEQLDKSERNLWIVNGKLYDFTEWIPKHPGGAMFFELSVKRDISAAVFGYHKNAEKVLGPLLRKYEVKMDDGEDAKSHLATDMGVPPFILPPGFDATKHLPAYKWGGGERTLQRALEEKLAKPEMVKRIHEADQWWDYVSVALLAVHLFLSFPALCLGWLPAWVLVLALAVTRTSLAAVGHYHTHRAKDGHADCLEATFDAAYHAHSLIIFDGHVLLHHLYTETPGDVKRTVFTAVTELPRLVRVPLFTVHKFGQFLTGWLIRFLMVHFFPPRPYLGKETAERQHLRKKALWLAARTIMVGELALAAWCGRAWLWAAQFALTLWLNMFLIVSSHNFEEAREAEGYEGLDWGTFQVQHSLDTYVTGVAWVDVFLTAGLGCHRAHHVLPYQKSGFANIASEGPLRETCAEFGVPWERKRHLLVERVLPLMWKYWTMPAQKQAVPKPILYGGPGLSGFLKEHLSVESAWFCIKFVLLGFLGEGSI